MEAVKSFNDELSGIYKTNPPISRAKMTILTKKAIKGIKYYKHIVQSIEKFIQKCRPEYKVPGLYVIDSVVRQSRHQFGADKDVFMPRLCKNIIQTFTYIYKCPPDQKSRILRVLNLWQKNQVFPIETVQQLMVMGGAPQPSQNSNAQEQHQDQEEPQNVQNLTNVLCDLLADPDAKRVEDLAKILSTSQRQQIEQLLKKVEKNQEPEDAKPHDAQQGYDRSVLDFDYEEKTPDHQMDGGMMHHHHQQQQQFMHKPEHQQYVPNSVVPQQYQPPPPQHMNMQQNAAFVPSAATPSQLKQRRLEEEEKKFAQQLQQIGVDESSTGMITDTSNDRRKRSGSRSRSRDRRHRRHRSRSRDRRSRHRSRSRDRSSHRRKRSRSRDEHERRRRKGLPPLKSGYISVCSKTIWIGNISAKVVQAELQTIVEDFGKIESINMIPPRGCAYIVMESRPDASYALRKLKHQRLVGKSLKCDWAASKDMPDEQKETWVKEHGVNYVPIPDTIVKVKALSEWGFVDPDSLPEHFKVDEEVAEPTTAPPHQINNQHQLQQQQQPPPQQQLHPHFTNTTTPVNLQAQPPQHFILNNPTRQPLMLIRHPHHHHPQFATSAAPIQLQSAAPTLATAPTSSSAINSTVEEMDIDGGSPEPMANQQQGAGADGMNPVAMASAAQQMQQPPPGANPFGPISVAQRFPGPMPVQIRMMPAAMGQPMQHRMMMPLRMGIPMQMRPGFHAVAPRMQAGHGPPQMLANPIQHHHIHQAGFRIGMQPMRPMHPHERMTQPPPEHQGIRAPVPPPQMSNEQNSVVLTPVSGMPPTAARDEPERPSPASADNQPPPASTDSDPFMRHNMPQPPPSHDNQQEPPSGGEGGPHDHRGGHSMLNGGPPQQRGFHGDEDQEGPQAPEMFGRDGGRRPIPPEYSHDRPPYGGRRDREDFDRRNRDWDSRGGRGRRGMRGGDGPWGPPGHHGGPPGPGYRNDDFRPYRGGPPPHEGGRPYRGGFNRGGPRDGFGSRGDMMNRGWSGGRRSPPMGGRGGRSPPGRGMRGSPGRGMRGSPGRSPPSGRGMRGSPPGRSSPPGGPRGGRSPSGGRRTRSPPPSSRARSPSYDRGGDRDRRRERRSSRDRDDRDHRRRRYSPGGTAIPMRGEEGYVRKSRWGEAVVVEDKPSIGETNTGEDQQDVNKEISETDNDGNNEVMPTVTITSQIDESDKEEGQLIEDAAGNTMMQEEPEKQLEPEVEQFDTKDEEVNVEMSKIDSSPPPSQLDTTIEEGEVCDD